MNTNHTRPIDVLEKNCHLETEATFEPFWNAVNELGNSAKEQRTRYELKRILRCIIDTPDLFSVMSDLSNLAYTYAMSLDDDTLKATAIYLEEVIQAAPEMLQISPVYFGKETFTGAIMFLYDENWLPILSEPTARAFLAIPEEKQRVIFDYIENQAQKDAEKESICIENTQYGIVLDRIKNSIKKFRK